jgi:tetratricopeptide (TPR) repeat protein
VWLKAKGDDFLRAGDVRSALNAYGAALDLDPKMLPCLANRSVCYLRCGEAAECRADCSAAIAIIAEEESQNAVAAALIASAGDGGAPDSNASSASSGGGGGGASKNSSSTELGRYGSMLVKLLLRRGAASCQLGQFTEALVDYHDASAKFQHLSGQQASSFQGAVSVESIAADILRLKLLVGADASKKAGDALLAEGKPQEALGQYTAALATVPVHVGCLSNRAACRMALGDLAGCVEDCSAAVYLLQADAAGAGGAAGAAGAGGAGGDEQTRMMLATVLPPAGSTKRTSWVVKTLLRRGVALCRLQRLDEAAADYSAASALDPSNEAIQRDADSIRKLRDDVAAAAAATPVASMEGNEGSAAPAKESEAVVNEQ